MAAIRAVLFDKDGTLFDFHKTWAAWTAKLIRDLGGDRAEELAQAMRFDLGAGKYFSDSPLIAGTSGDWVRLMLPVLPHYTRTGLLTYLDAQTAAATQVPATPLAPLLTGLRSAGYPLGVATNDGLMSVTSNLKSAGIHQFFDFVAGYDSGHGPKPGPGMLLAFAAQTDLPPANIVMVGDSTHDMEAATAAGMRRVAVLTGYATPDDLSPHAEAVLPTIADLPLWLANQENP